MAWIAKNSATMQIDRRDDPYLTDALKKQLEDEIVPRYDTREAVTMPALHLVQDTHGWLPHQALEEIADFLGLPASQVLDTATFYEEYWLKPHGKYVIWVCQSLSCEILGQKNLTQKISEHLGVEPGETTDDGKFTLMDVECLGSCGTAPCALVNHKLHENITYDNFQKVLDGLE
jgi:NADH-quinone oxidoreductase subunit E